MNYFIVLFLSIIGSLPVLAAEKNNNEDIKGAACLIRAEDKLVMINEIITGKISLPAGGLIDNESAQHSAEREAWEETGLIVSAQKELGRKNGTVYFDCVADSNIVAFEFQNSFDGFELPIWFAPHYGVEVSSAMLVNPYEIASQQYRYPQRWQEVLNLFQEASIQEITYVSHLIEAAPYYNQVELSWMVALQQSLAQMSDVAMVIFQSMILNGQLLTQPALLLILLPIVFWQFGTGYGYKILFAVTVTSLISLVAQQGFELPRPHDYLPVVELSQSYGYGFPNLATAIWFCVGILLLNTTNKLGFNRYFAVFIGLVSWMIFEQFYTGGAFLVDSIGGALLGSLCAWHLIRLEARDCFDINALLSSVGIWLVLIVGCVILTLLWPIPVFTAWLTTVISIALVVFLFKGKGSVIDIKHLIFIVLALLLINEIFNYAKLLVTDSSVHSLVVELLRYPVIIFVFVFAIQMKIIK
ncbi:phosphatase PAP2 family protein [Vibrio sinensis]|uniref:Phosphatase PAP2 family protein n=1 Tax=Vibrio sinensis TaxID=2302434 RepID=A0A3A6QNL9_9VIBR|nr:bifunctional NUDIX hydrolase/phosphatase PAP2 family protein [Vibrio sinensis]RJX72858.1 phosphatase PAP2 family protein [Vibrio sinensis]